MPITPLVKVSDIALWIRQSYGVRGVLFPFYLLWRVTQYIYYKAIKRGHFSFEGRELPYFYHLYNVTFHTERCVEISIALSFYDKHLQVLEVGNVLRHYFSMAHDVVDKYEKAEHVINEDILTFRPQKKYDLILSISTIEHVGWDDEPREPGRCIAAVEYMEGLLSPRGRMVVIIPIGYNPSLDAAVRKVVLPFDRQIFLVRVSRQNRWREATLQEAFERKYGAPYPCANAICVGIREEREPNQE